MFQIQTQVNIRWPKETLMVLRRSKVINDSDKNDEAEGDESDDKKVHKKEGMRRMVKREA